jgi:riboflavin kinase/FMN adenylyltransferase
MPTVTLSWTDPPPPAVTGGAVTVGNFDGVHHGHRELVAAARRWADRLGGPAVAVTFDPPPAHLLYPQAIRPPLTTLVDRADLLHAAGADHVVVLRTDAGLLSLSPEAFFEDVLLRQFRVTAVAEGYNFRFGRGRAGDVNTLRDLCAAAGVGFEEVPPQVVAGEAVSSSRVRAALAAGDVALAAELLGRPYRIAGRVVAGAKRGRTIGFPTANLDDVETLLPKEGVYAVRAAVGGDVHPAAANVGPNPTFGEDARKIEVHLIGYTGDLYGAELAVEFAAWLRDTRPFAGVAELVEQLRQDVAAAARLLAPPAGGPMPV